MGDASKSLAPASGAGYFCTVPVDRPSPGAMLACPSVQWSFARGDVFEGSGTEAWEWRPVAATTRERQRAARSMAWDCRLEGGGRMEGLLGNGVPEAPGSGFAFAAAAGLSILVASGCPVNPVASGVAVWRAVAVACSAVPGASMV